MLDLTKTSGTSLMEFSQRQVDTGSKNGIARAGKAFVERVFQEEENSYWCAEKYAVAIDNMLAKRGYAREDLKKADNTALFTTVIASFIEKALRPELVAEGVIKKVGLNLNGADSIKIPKGEALTAEAVGTDGTVSASEVDYGSLTISVGWIGALTTLVHQLLQVSAFDLVTDKLEEIGFAISKKIDSDIVAEILKATTKDDATYGDNSNYSYLGSTTYIDYAKLVTGITNFEANYGKPTHIIVHPTDKARILGDTDIKASLTFGTTPAGDILPQVRTLFDMKLLTSTQVTADKLMMVQADKLGYYLDASPVETWDGRIPNKIAFEVIGAKCYGVGIPRPKYAYTIHQNAVAPT